VTRRFIGKTRQLAWAPERTVLFGQSIPPSCDGVALRLLARRLRRIASVTVRDDESARKLAGQGVTATVSPDTAFALTRDDADFAAARAAYFHQGLAAETTALFSVRSFNRMYPASTEGYVARLAETMRLLNASNWRVAVLLQADVDACDGDRAMIEALRAEVPGLAVIDPFAHGDTPWRTALGAVAMAGTVIGTRYHTAIFGMIAGRAPVSLWYSNKGEDLGRRFALPGASADAFDPARIAALARDHAGAGFDPAPVRRQVRTDFASAIAAVPDRAARRTSAA